MHTPFVRVGRYTRSFAHSFILIAAVAGCGDNVTVPEASRPGAAGAEARASLSAAAPVKDVAASAAPPIAADQLANSAQPSLTIPTMVIRNGTVTIEVDSLEAAITAVKQIAVSLGGYIGNTSRASGEFNVRTATIELRIPSARFDNAMSNLHPIGKIESETSTAEDVGEEFFDITARQANARRLEERLITLLATRTGKLEDVLVVERELARVREEIERYEGRLRYLKSHVATSTLSVTVHEKRAVVSGYTGRNVIAESFKNAWRIFVSFVAVAISSLGWIIPVGALVLAGFYISKRVAKKP